MSPPIGYEERLAMLRNFVEADPENEMAHFSLGKLLLEGKDHAGAETSLRRALELNPDHAQARRCLGQALIDTGRRDEAIAMLREGVATAHARGDYGARNAMQGLLRSVGVDPPDPVAEELERRGIAPGSFACSRCGLPNGRLSEAPFDTPLGKRIQETVCEPCWTEWMRLSVRVINEYRLNLAAEDGGRLFDHHLREFLALSEEP